MFVLQRSKGYTTLLSFNMIFYLAFYHKKYSLYLELRNLRHGPDNLFINQFTHKSLGKSIFALRQKWPRSSEVNKTVKYAVTSSSDRTLLFYLI